MIDEECNNCGMIDVPLTAFATGGYCDGCVCLHCKRDAGECGGSMNDMGWCDECESKLWDGTLMKKSGGGTPRDFDLRDDPREHPVRRGVS